MSTFFRGIFYLNFNAVKTHSDGDCINKLVYLDYITQSEWNEITKQYLQWVKGKRDVFLFLYPEFFALNRKNKTITK